MPKNYLLIRRSTSVLKVIFPPWKVFQEEITKRDPEALRAEGFSDFCRGYVTAIRQLFLEHPDCWTGNDYRALGESAISHISAKGLLIPLPGIVHQCRPTSKSWA